MARLARLLAALGLAAALLAAAPARAGDVELAVFLTERGIEKQDAGDHVAARAFFERALAEVDHPKIRYFLGKSLHALGRLELALAEFRRIEGDPRVGKYAAEIAAFVKAIEGEQERRRLAEELDRERKAREQAEDARRRLAEEQRRAEERRAAEEAVRRQAEEAARREAERQAGDRARELEEARRGGGPGAPGMEELDAPADGADEAPGEAAPGEAAPGGPVPPWLRPPPGGGPEAEGGGEDDDEDRDVEPPGAGERREVEPPREARRPPDSAVRRADPGAGRDAGALRREDPAADRWRAERLASKILLATGLGAAATGVALAWNPLDREGDSASDGVRRTGRILLGAGGGALVIAWALWPKDPTPAPRGRVAATPPLRVAPAVGGGGAGLVVGGGF